MRSNSSLVTTAIKSSYQQQQHQYPPRHPRTLSNSSSNSFGENTYFKQLDTTKSNSRYINNSANLNDTAECFICQREIKNQNRLITCGSQNCSSVFCSICLTNYCSNTKSQKCPACRNNLDKTVLSNLREKTHSVSAINPDRLNFSTSNTYSNNSGNHHNHSDSNHTTRGAITDAKIYVRVLDEPCEGYENYRTLLVTFEIDDGIQNVIFLNKI